MGKLFVIKRDAHAQSTTNDSITIDVPAGRTLRVIEAQITGMASAAAAGAEAGVFASSGGSGGGSSAGLTIQRLDANKDSESLPSGFSVTHSYTTQPTLSGGAKPPLHFQPLGGKDKFLAVPGAEAEFWSASAHQVSLRGINGTPNIAARLVVELD